MFGKKYDTATTDEMPSAITAGCGVVLDDAQVEKIIEEHFSDGMSTFEYYFFQGFIGGLSFAGVPKDKETFGMNPREYANNFLALSVSHECEATLRECAESILASLDGDGDDE